MKSLSILIASLMFIGCQAKDAIQSTIDMNKKMDQTINGIEGTHGIAEKGALARAIEMMDKDEILAKLYPAPTDMLIWAQVFGENIKPKDLVTYFYVLKKDIEEVLPEHDLYPKGPSEAGAPEEKPYTVEQLSKIRRQKQGRWMELMAIAGLAPQAKVEAIVNEQIFGNGRFQRDALNLLMMRAWFLVDVILDRSLLKNGLPTAGHVRDTLDVLEKVQWIASLPFAKHIGFEYDLSNIKDVVPMLKIELTKLNMQEAGLDKDNNPVDPFEVRLRSTWSEALMKAKQGFKKAMEVSDKSSGLPQATQSDWESLISRFKK